MEYLQRRQLRNEDARQYYTDKLRLFVQAYPPARRSLVEFKTRKKIRHHPTNYFADEKCESDTSLLFILFSAFLHI